jgi:hypothetical protein
VMERVSSRLSVIKMCWRDPFGVAVGAFSGDPAAGLDQWVVLPAGEGQLVDVGGAALRPLVDVVDFAFVPGHVTTGASTAAVLGTHAGVRWGPDESPLRDRGTCSAHPLSTVHLVLQRNGVALVVSTR